MLSIAARAARGLLALPAGKGRAATRLFAAAPTTFPLSGRSAPAVEYAGAASDYDGDLLLLPFWDDKEVDVATATSAQAWDTSLNGALSALAEREEFKGKKGETCVVTVAGVSAVQKIALVGLGPKAAGEKAYAALGKTAAELAKAEKAKTVGVAAPSRSRDAWRSDKNVEAFALAACEGSYSDDRFRTGDNVAKPSPLSTLSLVDEPSDVDDDAPDDAYAPSLDQGPEETLVDAATSRARAYATGSALARDLVNAPANVLTPRSMAIAAVELAKEHSTLTVTTKGPVECAALGMGAFLGVAQGASQENEAQFIHLTYKNGVPKTKLCVVGKGLTYDSGGYNLKPSAGGSIELMKFDMGGAAATLGCAATVAALNVPDCEVHFVIAACENMISADAVRPGDVLTASNGKTIEVANTDAEGRLTLADALHYAEGLGVEAIVDLATLTGACVVALGDDYAGLFSTDDALASELLAAAGDAREDVWRMPLPPAYEEDIKSKIADLKNVGSRAGGAITAALFLGHFVDETPHAHIDIAGPVWNNKAASATGFGAKTMAKWVVQRAAATDFGAPF